MTLSEHLLSLAKPARRAVLRQVSENAPHDISSLSEREELAEGHAEDLCLQLHHVHLPKLEKRGYIRYDRETGTITKGPNFDEIDSVLRSLNEYEDELVDP
ncbi:DUF7344 domain-containing protein [Halegenticoccus soli]|uniref:DUF7344 domain-containing protein n=1 Tax=Halegenticoccus soli TaxID=1985678 RepID=UPI000C6D9996|nr:helix-turn-helix transcriptional regulator [Halegenticoccus soli]